MTSKRKSNPNQKSLDSFFTFTSASAAKRPRLAPAPDTDTNTSICTGASTEVMAVSDPEPRLSGAVVSSSLPVAYSKDIGHYVGRALSQEEKTDIMLNAWQPDIKVKFPSSGTRNLKFQSSWLRDYDWLRYSAIEDGAYCIWCMFFSANLGCGKGRHEQAGQLVTSKFCKWKDAKETFNKHQNSQLHTNSRVSAANFLAIARGEIDPINTQIDSALKREIDENRRKIKPIIETVLFCGREGLPLRGTKETSKICPSEESEIDMSAEREGNFRALLRFKLNSNDTDLADHFKSAAANAKYTSPEIQNELVDCCKDIVLKQLVEEINAAKGFSVLADETTDESKTEQLVICIRYLKEDIMKEVFLIFVPVTDLRGTALADVIINTLKSLGIDIQYMFGQGYDGASAMSSRFQGVQAYVRASNPLAIYVHCSSHSFNLAISDACDIPAITNCMAVLSCCYDFFKYPKRHNELLQAIAQLKPEATATRLKKLCATRWTYRHESAITGQELLGPINLALENIISTWSDKEAIASATSLQKSIADGGFLVTLHIVTELFAVSLPLSRQLQTQNMDLAEAMSLADSAQCALQKMRDEAEPHFRAIFSKAQQAATGLDVSIEIPRLCVLPVTTATAERTFSTLRYLKNYLRTCCAQSRLNGLTHLYIHRDIPCTPEKILDEFAKKTRRIRLKY